jgi:branched-chain amino acid transport system substrate-binding protein
MPAVPLSAPRWLIAAGVALSLALGACARPAPAPPPVEPEGPPAVALEIGPTSPEDEERAAALVDSARAALAAERWDAARAAAGTVVAELPRSRVSGDALELVGRAAAGVGEWDEARQAAVRLARILPASDERVAGIVLLEARSLTELERPAEALGRLLDMPAPTPEPLADEARGLARELAAGLPRDVLGRVLQATPLGQPLAAPVMVEYAGTLLLAGERDEARRFARAALEAGAVGDDAEAAEALLEDRVPGADAAPARLGALLPLSGSPALRAWAEGIREGIEAALAGSGLADAVEIEILDDGGESASAGALVRAAEGQGIVGLVGPLQDDALTTASRARAGVLPLVSPTALRLQDDSEGVYSLGSADPGAPRALAEWAARAGIRQVVVLHPAGGASVEEVLHFTEAYQDRGGSVLRTLTYQPGATDFQEQIRIVEGLRPDALVLPVPPSDVVSLAPQVTFFGLDTLGVQILGTAGWADEDILRDVSPRHLDGVVAVTPQRPGEDSEGFRAFVDAYESHFRRSLLDPAIPALGYDAASLLLLAIRTGARSPEAVRRALEDIEGFAGATGTLSIEDGRVVREHHLVCLWQRQLRPMGSDERPQPVYRPHVADSETGIVPEGPGRRAGSRCPDVPEATPPGSVGR